MKPKPKPKSRTKSETPPQTHHNPMVLLAGHLRGLEAGLLETNPDRESPVGRIAHFLGYSASIAEDAAERHAR
jgi:hypothetical protein